MSLAISTHRCRKFLHHMAAFASISAVDQVVDMAREGQILTSIPGIGPTGAATIIAMIGTIANFDRPAQLKSYFGWAPMVSQSGTTLNRAKLTPRGVRLMKYTIFLCVWQAVRQADNEFARLYEHLVPRKCRYDERKRAYVGKNKVIGRVAGQLITIIFTLLKRDQELLAKSGMGSKPQGYDPEIHRRHRAGEYRSPSQTKLGNMMQLPSS